MIDKGYREVTLLGQNVNSYNWIEEDKEINFPKLVEMIAKINPNLRVRFTTSHPKDISDELIEVIARYNNVCKHIHLPVQAGSNAVLERMNRKYTREYYLERVKKIRTLIPNCGLTTDVFVDFQAKQNKIFCKHWSFYVKLSSIRRLCLNIASDPELMPQKNYPMMCPKILK